MKRIILSFALTLALSTQAHSQVPPDVMKAYKSYNTSMTNGDYKAAIKHAKVAWTRAEDALGESALTGDLAYNYGYVEKNKGDNKKAIKALERSAELAKFKKEDAELIRLEREIETISSLEATDKARKAGKRVEDALKFAEASGLSNSVFAGELHLHDANACIRSLNSKISSGKPQLGSLVQTGGSEKAIKSGQKRCGRIAERAVSIFEALPQQAQPGYVSSAHKLSGYAHETNEDWLSAALSYQKARKAVEDVYPRNHPLVADSIGRWINARNYLKRLDRLEFAKSKGLCDCWPYSQTEKGLEPIETVQPDFPAAAKNLTSGYAIVEFDISDEGDVKNVKVINSWPEDVYDKPSITAVKQWKYPVKQQGEPDGYRNGVSEVLNYYLRSGLDPI